MTHLRVLKEKEDPPELDFKKISKSCPQNQNISQRTITHFFQIS